MAERAAVAVRTLGISRRGRVVFAILLAAGLAWATLGLSPADALPKRAGGEILSRFLAGAVSPALDYEGEVPDGTVPLLWKVAAAVRTTVVFAAAAMSLSIVIGLVLGFLGATAWWSDGAGTRVLARSRLRRCMPIVYAGVRALIAMMRSVHEILWAILFLAAFGLNSFSAVVAIAIPYGGTLAKVFSEMLDECPRESARSLRAIGAGPVRVLLFGLLPRAASDMSAYTYYRFECAIRSSAILGFFGFPTLGYYLKLSAENIHYREVWTYLYALIAISILFELWSALLRRRMVLR